MSSSSSRGWIFAAIGVVFIAIALIANEWVLGAWLTVGGRVANPASRLVLALLDLGALIFGLALVVRRDRAPWRQMLLSVAATLVTLLIAEGGLRLVFAVRSWTAPQSPSRGRRDRLAASRQSSGRARPAGSGISAIRQSGTAFRMYGDPRPRK